MAVLYCTYVMSLVIKVLNLSFLGPTLSLIALKGPFKLQNEWFHTVPKNRAEGRLNVGRLPRVLRFIYRGEDILPNSEGYLMPQTFSVGAMQSGPPSFHLHRSESVSTPLQSQTNAAEGLVCHKEVFQPFTCILHSTRHIFKKHTVKGWTAYIQSTATTLQPEKPWK